MKATVLHEKYLAKLLWEAVKKGNEKLINEAVKTVVEVLKKNRRLGMAESVIREYRRVLIKNDMASEMILESAQEIPSALQNKIKEALSIEKNVPVKHRVKPELIGGAVVQYRNKRWDFSIKNRMIQLEKNLLQA